MTPHPIGFPDSLWQQILAEAERRHWSAAQVVREAVRAYLEEQDGEEDRG